MSTTTLWSCWSWRTPARRRLHGPLSASFRTCLTRSSARCVSGAASCPSCWPRWCASRAWRTSSPWTCTRRRSRASSTAPWITWGPLPSCFSTFKRAWVKIHVWLLRLICDCIWHYIGIACCDVNSIEFCSILDPRLQKRGDCGAECGLCEEGDVVRGASAAGHRRDPWRAEGVRDGRGGRPVLAAPRVQVCICARALRPSHVD